MSSLSAKLVICIQFLRFTYSEGVLELKLLMIVGHSQKKYGGGQLFNFGGKCTSTLIAVVWKHFLGQGGSEQKRVWE